METETPKENEAEAARTNAAKNRVKESAAREGNYRSLVRDLPNSSEAELGVLSSMIIGGPQVIEDVKAKLTGEAFYVPAHRICFDTMCSLQACGQPVDLITYTQQMRDEDLLDTVGGPAFVTSLWTFVPTAANVIYYLEIVREKWLLREMIANCTSTIRRAYDEQDDVNGLVNDHVSKAIELHQLGDWRESIRHVREFVVPAVEEIKATYHNRGKPIGLETGFVDLDRMTGGLQAPLTYYFAGRPAMGKSSVMVEVAEHVAITNALKKIPVGIFSVEMTGRQLAKRIICSRGDIDLQRMRDGFLDRFTFDRLDEEAAEVTGGNMWIDDTSNLSIFEFRSRARRMVMKYGCQVLIIDYLQRMHSTSRRAQGNREQEINEIAQGISATAKELNVPIIVLAQLNRKSEERVDKIPQLADLRESGSIEQEARFVGLLHRPSYYVPSGNRKKAWLAAKVAGLPVPDNWDDRIPDGEEDWFDLFERHAELIVAKQNEGGVGTIRLRFIKEFARFESLTEKLFSNNPNQRQAI